MARGGDGPGRATDAADDASVVVATTADAFDTSDPVFAPARAAYAGFDAWAAKAAAERRPCLVVRDGAGLAAVAVLKPRDCTVKLCCLAVRPDARGRGLGSALLGAVAETAGDRPVRVTILRDNADGLRFLASRGFVDVGDARPGEALLVRSPRVG